MTRDDTRPVAIEQEAEDAEFLGVDPFELGDRDPDFVARFAAWWNDRATIMVGEPLEVDDVSDPFPSQE